VLVVDNASSDGTPEKLATEFPGVRLRRNAENLRYAGGNNVGLREALGAGAEAVVLLNNDTEADPELWVRLLQALDEHGKPAAACPIIYFDRPPDLVWYAGGRLAPALGWASHRGTRRRDRGRYRRVERTGYLTGCCLLAPRAVWERVGLLDDGYHFYAEDADWCLRARRAGVDLLFVPTARLWHRVSASLGGARSPRKAYQKARANLRFFSKHARGAARWTWWPAYAAQQSVLGVLALLRGEPTLAGALVRAFADHARGRPVEAFQP
jgi:GT2 family glycosyltransferase